MKNEPVLYGYKLILALSYDVQTTRFRNQIQSKIKRPRLFLSFSSLFRFLITYLFMNFFYTHLLSCSHSSLFLLNSSLKGSFKHLFKEKKVKVRFLFSYQIKLSVLFWNKVKSLLFVETSNLNQNTIILHVFVLSISDSLNLTLLFPFETEWIHFLRPSNKKWVTNCQNIWKFWTTFFNLAKFKIDCCIWYGVA